MEKLSTITETLMTGDADKLSTLVKEALDSEISAKDILNKALIPGMDAIGEKMETGEMFIPEVLMAAQAMSHVVDEIKPLLAEGDVNTAGKIIIGTVQGDLHDIGKNLVAMMFESAGFEVTDLGVDVSPEKFIDAINEKQPDVVGISALLTTTMDMMKKTIDMISEKGLRDKVKIVVGGAPVNKVFAEEIGADGYAPDAGSATKLVKSMLN